MISTCNGLLATGELPNVEPVLFKQNQSISWVENAASWEIEVLVKDVGVVQEVKVRKEPAGSCAEYEELGELWRKYDFGSRGEG